MAKKVSNSKTEGGLLKTKKLVLLDAHAILHRAYHALPDFSSSKGEPTGALYGLAAMIIRIAADLKPDYLIGAFDLPGPTFRREAYEQYKGTRKKTDDELIAQIKRSRDVFKAFNIPAYDKPGFEADDILGTIVEKLKDRPDIDIMIASGDMDTLQLVNDKKVRVYTLKKGITDTIVYDEEAVLERFGFGPELLPDYKGLRGDPSDNIIGIAGIGEKTATTLITNFGSIENIYKKLKSDKKAFEKAGIKERIVKLLEEGEEEAEFSKMLATIRRDAPIDFVLPEAEWKTSVDVEAIMSLFNELDFRTLGARVKELFRKETGTLLDVSEGQKPAQDIPPKELKEISTALWLINSNLTAPTLEDIFNFAKTEKWEEARNVILGEIEKRGLHRVFKEIELPLMPVIEKMEERGVKIDTRELDRLSQKYHAELLILQNKIWEHAGGEFNINSPKQLGEVLFDTLKLTAKNLKKTEGGAKSTRESELVKMRELHPIIDLILSYRELSKLLTTYIDTIPKQLDEQSRLHTTFLQAGSTTGRMASTDPNLQNIPNKTDLGRAIRKAFIAEKGYSLVAFDYSQIELRIAAFLSGDEKLIEIFKSGQDVHTSVAAEVFGVPKEKVDKEMRRKAKVINFGIIYGMGINALRANLGTDRAEAQKFYNDYFANFKTLAEYLDKVKADTERKGYTETFFGRRRYFEGIKSKIPYIRASAERMAINAPIQGTGADITKLAMVHADAWTVKSGLGEKVYPLLQVHDELVYEIKDEEVDSVFPKIKKIMENVLPLDDTKGVPIVVDASVGKNWGDMENKFRSSN